MNAPALWEWLVAGGAIAAGAIILFLVLRRQGRRGGCDACAPDIRARCEDGGKEARPQEDDGGVPRRFGL